MPQLRATVGDEMKFQNWYAKHYQANPKLPDDPDSDLKYDWRGAYQSGAKPDAGGNWPTQHRRK